MSETRMMPRPLLARAAARVLLRVLAKSAAYFAVAVALFALVDCARGAFGPTPRWIAAPVIACWALLALAVFCEKVREEAQRIGGRS